MTQHITNTLARLDCAAPSPEGILALNTSSRNGRRVGNGDMGWLRQVGSLKLQVSFAKKTYQTDDILHMRTIILRSPLIVATP